MTTLTLTAHISDDCLSLDLPSDEALEALDRFDSLVNVLLDTRHVDLVDEVMKTRQAARYPDIATTMAEDYLKADEQPPAPTPPTETFYDDRFGPGVTAITKEVETQAKLGHTLQHDREQLSRGGRPAYDQMRDWIQSLLTHGSAPASWPGDDASWKRLANKDYPQRFAIAGAWCARCIELHGAEAEDEDAALDAPRAKAEEVITEAGKKAAS